MPNGSTPKGTPSAEAQELRKKLVEDDPIYDVADVAHVLGIEQSSVLRHIRNGNLVATKLGKNYRIRKSELTAFMGRVERDAAKQASLTRIRREINEKEQVLKANHATAQQWASILCGTCGEMALVQKRFELDENHDFCHQWAGRCKVCDEKFGISIKDCTSFADRAEAEKEAQRFAAIEQAARERVEGAKKKSPEHGWHIVKCASCSHYSGVAHVGHATEDDQTVYAAQGTCYACRQRYRRTLAPLTTEMTMVQLAADNPDNPDFEGIPF